jgi:hypothetical protein
LPETVTPELDVLPDELLVELPDEELLVELPEVLELPDEELPVELPEVLELPDEELPVELPDELPVLSEPPPPPPQPYMITAIMTMATSFPSIFMTSPP